MMAGMNIQDRNIFADGAAYVNGDFVPVSEASVPLTDLGFIRSDATYDVVHVWNGNFFRLQDHVDRFLDSCDRLRFSLPLAKGELIEVLHTMVARTGFEKAYVNFTATRGRLAKGSRNPLDCENRVYGFTIPFSWIAPFNEQEAGIDMIVADPERTAPETMDPTIKNFQWGDLTRGMIEASDTGAKVAVHLNRHGNVTEGAGFNTFVFKDGTLWTPDTGVLMGITRRTVLEIAERQGLDTQITSVPERILRDADEIFISSTAGGVIPVRSLDGTAVGNNSNSRVALDIRDAYWALHDDPAYATPVRYDLAGA
jgi:branched-chain amino acid aminotransferase